jgi:hypothetical protein
MFPVALGVTGLEFELVNEENILGVGLSDLVWGK